MPYAVPSSTGGTATMHRDWSAQSKGVGLVAAVAAALAGAWLGFHATTGLTALVTAILGSVAGANLALILLEMIQFTVERRRREQLPCAQPILGPAGARLGKRTATRHDGIGTSPRHRCSRRYWGIGRSGDLGRSVVSPVNGPVGVGLLSEDFGRMLSLSGDRSATQPGSGRRGRRFKSCQPDHKTPNQRRNGRSPTNSYGPLNDHPPEPRCRIAPIHDRRASLDHWANHSRKEAILVRLCSMVLRKRLRRSGTISLTVGGIHKEVVRGV
jgi:hypothetical protein